MSVTNTDATRQGMIPFPSQLPSPTPTNNPNRAILLCLLFHIQHLNQLPWHILFCIPHPYAPHRTTPHLPRIDSSFVNCHQNLSNPWGKEARLAIYKDTI